jgi:hypothetical protein
VRVFGRAEVVARDEVRRVLGAVRVLAAVRVVRAPALEGFRRVVVRLVAGFCVPGVLVAMCLVAPT